MTTTGILINPDGTTRTVNTTAEALKEAIGGWFDVFDTPHASVWCDDEGILKNLPLNQPAITVIKAIYAEDGQNPGTLNLRGPAVFTGLTDDNTGKTTPLPTHIEQLIRNATNPTA